MFLSQLHCRAKALDAEFHSRVLDTVASHAVGPSTPPPAAPAAQAATPPTVERGPAPDWRLGRQWSAGDRSSKWAEQPGVPPSSPTTAARLTVLTLRERGRSQSGSSAWRSDDGAEDGGPTAGKIQDPPRWRLMCAFNEGTGEVEVGARATPPPPATHTSSQLKHVCPRQDV